MSALQATVLQQWVGMSQPAREDEGSKAARKRSVVPISSDRRLWKSGQSSAPVVNAAGTSMNGNASSTRCLPTLFGSEYLERRPDRHRGQPPREHQRVQLLEPLDAIVRRGAVHASIMLGAAEPRLKNNDFP